MTTQAEDMPTIPHWPIMKECPEIIAKSHGGLGKAIAFTAFLKALRANAKPNARIHIVSSWSDVFRDLPFIDRHFDQNVLGPYFAEDHRNYEVFSGEPYDYLDYRRGKLHIVDVWCKMAGIPVPEQKNGQIKILEVEHRIALEKLKGTDRSKKWIAFQPFGGHGAPMQQVRSFSADVAQAIADKLMEKGFVVIQLSLPEEKKLERVVWPDPGKGQKGEQNYFLPRTLFAMLHLCDGFVGIDSWAQHAWAAMGRKNGIVCWGATRPENLGYLTNRNLTVSNCPSPGCNRPDVLGDLVGGHGQVWACPNDELCMRAHCPDNIVQTLIEVNDFKVMNPPAEKGPVPPTTPASAPNPEPKQ
jgi:hypothetical protein